MPSLPVDSWHATSELFRSCGKVLDGRGKLFFIAHPGQNDNLYCSYSPPRVHNIAFALHCPDLVTPKGNWFLPLCCPFLCLLPLVLSFIPFCFRLFFPTFLSFYLPVWLFLVHTWKTTALTFFLCFSVPSFHEFYFSCLSPCCWLFLSCLHVLYSITKPPAIAFALWFIHNLHPNLDFACCCCSTLFFLYTPSICQIAPAFSFGLYCHCLSWLLFLWISYFPPLRPLFMPSLPTVLPSSSSLSSLFIGIVSLTISLVLLSWSPHGDTQQMWGCKDFHHVCV